MNKFLKEKLGILLFAGAMLFYILFKLPSDTSVLCGNGNEGFYFIYGHHLLNGKHLYTDILTVRGPLFIMFYSLVLMVFGFTTYSIIAVHLFHTLIIVLTGVAIYLITKNIIQNSLYSGLAVCFWTFFQITPIGLWGQRLELEGLFALEAEYFCILFSLYSIIGILFTFKSNQHRPLLSFCSGLMMSLSIMFKASGAVIAIAMLCWIAYLLLFEKKTFFAQKNNILLMCSGLFISLLLFVVSLYIYNGELASFWQSYFMFGSYSKEPLSLWLLILRIKRFMFRYVSSYSNFILFFVSFFFLMWGLIRGFVIGKSKDLSNFLLPLISIWGVGNACSIIAIGDYGSYYYLLMWPSISIVLSIGLNDMFSKVLILHNSVMKIFVVLVMLLFALNRLQTILPGYFLMAGEQLKSNILRQPQSFQDPVLSYDLSSAQREAALRIGDVVNSYLPDKKDSLYIFAFAMGHQYFSPSIYIYAKRPPVSAITSDWLHYEKFSNVTLTILRRQLYGNLPKILIVPENSHLKEWQIKTLMPFLYELNYLLAEKYHLKDKFHIELESKEKDVYQVFERN